MTDITLHHNDLPASVKFNGSIAVDCEMMGLQTKRDRLCLVQLKDEKGPVHLVKFADGDFKAPNLKKLLEDPKTLKIFQYGQVDLGMLGYYLGAKVSPVYDTKIASRIARTYTDKHGLKELTKDLLGVELLKDQTSSDWGAATLTDKQMHYAADDVRHLHAIKAKIDEMLIREGRMELAQAAFQNIITNAALEVAGYDSAALFQH
jgi:ribonuclease D